MTTKCSQSGTVAERIKAKAQVRAPFHLFPYLFPFPRACPQDGVRRPQRRPRQDRELFRSHTYRGTEQFQHLPDGAR